MALGVPFLAAAVRWELDSNRATLPTVATLFRGRVLPRRPCSLVWVMAASELLDCIEAGGERELAELAASLDHDAAAARTGGPQCCAHSRTRGGPAARFATDAIECGREPVATWKHDRCRGVHAFHAAPRRGVSSRTPRPLRSRRTGEAAHPGPPATAADATQRREREHHGRRIGEADHPGPDSEAANRRQPAFHARSDATVAAWSPPGRFARPPSGNGCCRNLLGHTQLHHSFPFTAGRYPLGSGGADGTRRGDAGLHAATFARAAASHAFSRC